MKTNIEETKPKDLNHDDKQRKIVLEILTDWIKKIENENK